MQTTSLPAPRLAIAIAADGEFVAGEVTAEKDVEVFSFEAEVGTRTRTRMRTMTMATNKALFLLNCL